MKALYKRSYNESNVQENASSHISFSSLITVCWIDETASNLVPFIAVFNLGNKKSQSAISQGSRVDGISRGSLVSQKLGENARRMCRCIVVQKIQGPTFLKLKPNAMNSRSISESPIKFTVYNVFFRHKFMMNDTFRIKKCSQHCFYPRFLHSHFLSFEPFMHSNILVLDEHSSLCALFSISNVSVAV
jgi:hypothetical protein